MTTHCLKVQNYNGKVVIRPSGSPLVHICVFDADHHTDSLLAFTRNLIERYQHTLQLTELSPGTFAQREVS